ncbi:NAD-dependent epimerase/dehydratase family protein [Streptomyces avidinii]|uniref:NAD-dependent epimerase/dehydratase family protein n=1 Tax=Streptomyces avidinii TaxID=1895 RepID=UPI00386658F6|nr:NAD-dependent epimerase/dehydratase family protein [Streptomyces avidinii]
MNSGSGAGVLVTGAAGFVGSAVVECLVGRGVGVRALVHRAGVRVGVEEVWGDLAVAGSLRGCVRGWGRCCIWRRGSRGRRRSCGW